MGEIALAPMERILKNAGAERVSESAAKRFAEVVEGLAQEIGEGAAKLSKHAGRKTVKREDIRLAKKL
ncbi:MAG: NFYB/HAP3 family transcription factor subunit [Candidatus Aenigmarchaeota archaeon]|nr:NFYB/HAP3 family transcription factor subunit [Candidatus Aenigmarchaeota archaeon]